jgi:hypothetical protein
MANQPIIIEVLARRDHLIIQKRILQMVLLGAAFFLVTLLLTRDYLRGGQGLVMMGGILLLLLSNAILFFRNRMMDRYIKNLCIEDGRCYWSAEDPGTCASPPSILYYHQESFALRGKTHDPPASELAYQVLAQRDWQAVKHLSLPTLSS